MNTALLLIDIQNDYFPGGAMELVNSESAGQQAQVLLQKFRTAHLPIIHIQHVSVRANASFFLPGTQGLEIHECVRPLEGESVVCKNYPNSFRDTNLLSILRTLGIERLVIAGMMTQMCVDTTTRAAADLGFTNILVWDACATRDLRWQDQIIPAALVQGAYMAALQGLFAQVVSTQECLELI